MSIQESTPGVYINEITGPGVIQGVGTSTAAFVGPTPAGPSFSPRRVTNYDQFAAQFGGTGTHAPHLVAGGRLYHLGLAVQGFFQNGGTAAFITRVDNSTLGELALENAAAATVVNVRARTPEAAPEVSIVISPTVDIVFAQAAVVDPGGATSPIPGDATHDRLLDDASNFRADDRVITDGASVAAITDIDGNWIRPSQALADHATLSMAPLSPVQSDGSIRLDGEADVFRVGSLVALDNDAGSELVTVLSASGDRITTSAVAADFDLDGTHPVVTPATYQMAGGSTANVTVAAAGNTELTVDDPSGFAPGDVIGDGTDVATIVTVNGDVLTVDAPLAGATVSIVDLTADRNQFRLLDTRGLRTGTLVQFDDGAATAFGIVSSISTSGIVTLSAAVPRTVAIVGGASVEVVEFAFVVTSDGDRESFPGLSMSATSPGHLFSSVASAAVTVEAPEPPVVAPIDELTPVVIADQPLSPGTVGNPADLGLPDYQDGLDELQRIDDVNLVCAPDVASIANADVHRAIQQAIISHCLGEADRIAILDPPSGLPPSGPGSIEEYRGNVQSERGFAALYYPWVAVLDPTQVPPAAPRRITIPPSGHIAGVMARVDSERGVFKAPANVPVRNVLGVQRPITDREQAPLNRGGTNVLRVLPGSNDVMVWGARTTVDPAITDWMYVSVRRLLLFIEESIQESIRWAVFEPNDTGLWKSLERIIRAFLRQQWRAGALFGRAEEEAFSVRIDEGLNPPEVRNIGRLNIEIRVAPVRPAEFIVITIGLFDGGAEVDES